LALTLLVQSGAGAHAQDAGDRPSAGASDDMAEARRLFERGKAAMSEGRFAEARDMLQRSLDLVPSIRCTDPVLARRLVNAHDGGRDAGSAISAAAALVRAAAAP
jgi:hypothetical protein